MTNYYGLIREGDWVSGTTEWDEFFMGYVERVGDDGVIKVVVTQCDNEEKLHFAIEMKAHKLRLVPDSAPTAAEELRSLMELALMTRDEVWFNELHQRLAASPAAQAGRLEGLNRSRFYRSRLSQTTPPDHEEE